MVFGILLVSFFTIVFGFSAQYFLMNNGVNARLLSAPSFRRRHRRSIPLSGGPGIFLTFMGALVVLNLYLDTDLFMGLWPLLAAYVAMFLVGLTDDIWTIQPKVKLLGEILAASLVFLSPEVQMFIASWFPSIGYVIYPLIVFWIVGVTNAVNLVDGLDGLAGSYTFLAVLSLFAMYLSGSAWASSLTPILPLFAASLVPFLAFNYNPARVFMGDSGSLSLGFFIAVAALLKPPGNNGFTETLSIILVAGYPILDMGWVTYLRVKKGFSPFQADRSHLHYRLIHFDLNVPQTVLHLMIVNTVFLLGAYLLNFANTLASLAVLGIVGCVVLSFTRMIGFFDQWRVKFVESIRPVEQKSDENPLVFSAINFRIDMTPMFDALDQVDQETLETLLTSFHSHMKLKFPLKKGFIHSESRSNHVIGLKLADSENDVYVQISDEVLSWLQMHDVAIATSNLPIYIVEGPEEKDVKTAA